VCVCMLPDGWPCVAHTLQGCLLLTWGWTAELMALQPRSPHFFFSLFAFRLSPLPPSVPLHAHHARPHAARHRSHLLRRRLLWRPLQLLVRPYREPLLPARHDRDGGCRLPRLCRARGRFVQPLHRLRWLCRPAVWRLQLI
jgi:hypothetical protein